MLSRSSFPLVVTKFLCCFLFIHFFSSCSKQEEKIPSGILPKDKMVSLLVDIHLTEAAADTRHLNLPQVNTQMAKEYEEIFQKHGIRYEKFRKSYDYYLDHADQLSEIYAEVINQLTAMEGRVGAKQKRTPGGMDTLR